MTTKKQFVFGLICVLVVTVTGCSSAESIPTAIARNDIESIHSMIERGEDLNAVGLNGNTPLLQTLRQGESELAVLLIENGADVNISNNSAYTPLHEAVRLDQPELSALLIENGANINAVNGNGETPFHYAVTTSVAITRLLIDHGVNVSTATIEPADRFRSRETPLMLAINAHGLTDDEKLEILNLLIEHDADVNAEDGRGDTPLHFASSLLDHAEVAELLIENGANVNAKNHDGYTPLHVAVTVGITNTRLLIDHGADVKATIEPRHNDDTGVFGDVSIATSPRTPLDNAVANHNIQTGPNEWSPLSDGELIEIIRLLIENGA